MIGVAIVLVIVGVGLWLVNTKIPMESTVKTILNVFIILCVCLWLLGYTGYVPTPWSNTRGPVRPFP